MNSPSSMAAAVASVKRRLPNTLLAGVVLAWAVVVLIFYYRQLWQLVFGAQWDQLDRNTLAVLAFIAGMLLLAVFVAALMWGIGHRLDQRSRSRYGRWTCLFVIAVVGLAFLALTLALARRTIDPSLPYLRQALGRELIGAGAAMLLLLAAIALGLGISRMLGWHYTNWREGLPFAGSLGIGTFAYLGLALAMFGQYRPFVLQVIAALVVLATLAFAVRGDVQRNVRRGVQLPAPHLPRDAELLWIACAGLAILCASVAALAPESQYDALWYHLAYPQRYLETGRLVDVPIDFVSLYPMTTELWFGYGLALGGPTAAILLHLGFLLLSAIMTYEFARRYAPSASPWLAVALLVTVPTVIWLGSTANIDLALMLFVTLALYALLRYVESSRRQWLLLAALNLGLALASKHLALFALAIFCSGLPLALRRRGVGWRAAFMAVLTLGALGLLMALPWYLRSYLATGNPVFETMYTVFGAPAERWNAQTEAGARRFLNHFGRSRTIANLLTLPWHMTIHSASYGGTLGPLFLILLPMLALRRVHGAMPWLIAFAGLWLLLWSTPLSSFQMRHLMPIAPALAVLAAAAFGRAAGLARLVAGRSTSALLEGGMAMLLVLNLPPFTFLHEVDRVNWEGWLSSVLYALPWGVVIGGESADTYLTRQIRSYAVWQFADATLPPDARVLTWSGGEQFYTQTDRIWANSARATATAGAKTGEEEKALAGLRELGITHLIVARWPPESPEPWNAYALTGPVARADWYEELYSDYWYVLYRIRWETLEPAVK